ncbi:MAG: tRNA epoxyqueuosine(34) reductase QueG [Chloroflexota bacterium]
MHEVRDAVGRQTSLLVKRLGKEAGFDLVRIGSAAPLYVEGERYLAWVDEGRQGDMGWITAERARRSSIPGATLPDAHSIISVALAYGRRDRPGDARDRGRIARYAWGRDYHQELGQRLTTFAASLEAAFGGNHRWFVDTGPLMDKALAARSGLGWYGKNTNVLTEHFGSYVMLGEIVTTLHLTPDVSLNRDCGSCSLCVTACPTGALGPAYAIDARKCISYLTIEHRGAIPFEYRDAIGAWVFGCDICQDVCPPAVRPYVTGQQDTRRWQREVRAHIRAAHGKTDVSTPYQGSDVEDAGNAAFKGTGAREAVDLFWLLSLSHAQYLDAFRGTAIRRAKVWMLRRNAAVALGNVGSEEAIAPLFTSLQNDDHPLVRGHAAWALGKLAHRIGDPDIRMDLERTLEAEADDGARFEITTALML